MDECIKEAATVEDAVDAALEELGVQQDAVEYEVLEQPASGLFGIGAGRQAKVLVRIREGFAPAVDEEGVDEEGVEEEIPTELLSHEPADLSDEDLDKVADTAVEVLREVLAKLGVADPEVEEYEGDEREIILDVMGADMGLLIGRHGKTLDSLQTAVAAVTTRRLGFRYPVVVDVEGYRHRRKQKVEDIARRAADRAVRQRSAVRLRPMTAYERRVVHVVLRGDNRIATGSEGAEPFRQVVITPK